MYDISLKADFSIALKLQLGLVDELGNLPQKRLGVEEYNKVNG